jgi:6-phosphogluconolactonase
MKMLSSRTIVVVLAVLAMLMGVSPAKADDNAANSPDSYRIYIGTFTWHQSKGIYLMHLNATTGQLDKPELVAEAKSPAFLQLHPGHRFLYSVNEINNLHGKREGGASAFAIDPQTGKLSFLNQQPSAGADPTHICLDRDAKNLLLANYTTGSVGVLPIQDDGTLGPIGSIDQHHGKSVDKGRQEGPHAHCINVDPNNRFALSCDLGLDKIFVYKFDPAAHTITPNDPPFATVAPGSGPRHLAFAPNGKVVYVADEMLCTVTAFNYDAEKGVLTELQAIATLPSDFHGEKSSAEVAVHPSGKFLYVSNRGEANNIALFDIDPETGKLTPRGHTSTEGKAPRHFAIDPTGHWLVAANQDTNNVVVFAIDPQTGELKPTGANIEVPTPVCVLFVPHVR